MTDIVPLQYSKEQFDEIINVFRESGFDDTSFDSPDSPYAKFAEEAVKITSEQFADKPSEFFTFQGLKSGTSPYLDTVPAWQGVDPDDRKFTVDQIIKLTAADLEGNPIVQPTYGEAFSRGAKKGLFRGTGFTGGFAAGAKLANVALSGIPPVTLPTAAIRLGGPTITGLAFALGGERIAEGISKYVLDPGPPELPGMEGAEYAGELTAEGLATLPAVYLLPAKFSLGSAKALQALGDSKKIPLATRMVRGTEEALAEAGKFARKNPFSTAAVETGAISAAAGIGGELEQRRADAGVDMNPFLRFAIEGFAAPVGGAVIANFGVNVIPAAISGTVTGYRFVKKGGIGDAIENLSDRRSEQVGTYLIEQLELFGEDPEELIKRLADDKNANVFVDDAGNPLKMTAAMKTGSPALLALEMGLERGTTGLGTERKAQNQQLSRAIRNFITGTYASGDPRFLQLSAQVAESVFEADMRFQLEDAMTKVEAAYNRLRKTKADSPEQDALNIVDLGKSLQETVGNLKNKFRKQQKTLWNKLESMRPQAITEFKDADGEILNQPNFLSYYDSRVPDTPEAANMLLTGDIKALENFAERKRRELFPDPNDPEAEVIPLTVGETRDMISTARTLARKFGGGVNFDKAKADFANGMAKALEDDLYSLPEGVNFDYDMARAYSRAYNDAFTRTFAADLTRKRPDGRQVINAEDVGNRLFQSDTGYLRVKELDGLGRFMVERSLTSLLPEELQGEGAKLLRDLTSKSFNENTGMIDLEKLRLFAQDNADEIARFPGARQAIDEALNTTFGLRNNMELVLRDIRATAFEQGKVSKNAIKKWMDVPQNRTILEAMPNLKSDLENYDTALALLDENSALSKHRRAELKKEVSFLDLLPENVEDVSVAVDRAMGGPTPLRDLNRLFDIVDKAPENWQSGTKAFDDDGNPLIQTFTRADALAGLESAILDSIFLTRARKKDVKTNQTFDPREAYDQLFAPRFAAAQEGAPTLSLADWMEAKNLFGAAEKGAKKKERLKELMTDLVRFDAFAKGTRSVDPDDIEDFSLAFEFYLRVAGSRAGQMFSDILPGAQQSDLISRAAGSRIFMKQADNLFNQIPDSLRVDFMKKVLEDPDMTSTLLEKGKKSHEKKNRLGKLAAWLQRSGLAVPARTSPYLPRISEFEEETIEEEPVVEEPVPPPVSAVTTPTTVPATAPSPTTPLVSAPLQPRPAIASAPQAPTDRARFAALFPFDSTSALIRQQSANQGIGSLAG
jgi:hypothetical protein